MGYIKLITHVLQFEVGLQLSNPFPADTFFLSLFCLPSSCFLLLTHQPWDIRRIHQVEQSVGKDSSRQNYTFNFSLPSCLRKLFLSLLGQYFWSLNNIFTYTIFLFFLHWNKTAVGPLKSKLLNIYSGNY